MRTACGLRPAAIGTLIGVGSIASARIRCGARVDVALGGPSLLVRVGYFAKNSSQRHIWAPSCPDLPGQRDQKWVVVKVAFPAPDHQGKKTVRVLVVGENAPKELLQVSAVH